MFRSGCIGIVIDVELHRIGTILAFHSGEETYKAVIIIHGPTVKRMVVAFCTLNSHACKHLGHILSNCLGLIISLRQHGVEVGLRIGQITAAALHLGTHELI